MARCLGKKKYSAADDLQILYPTYPQEWHSCTTRNARTGKETGGLGSPYFCFKAPATEKRVTGRGKGPLKRGQDYWAEKKREKKM